MEAFPLDNPIQFSSMVEMLDFKQQSPHLLIKLKTTQDQMVPLRPVVEMPPDLNFKITPKVKMPKFYTGHGGYAPGSSSSKQAPLVGGSRRVGVAAPTT